jgi:hypothetical protein
MGTFARHGRNEAETTAPAEAVWRIIADITRVGEWSHECTGAHWVHGATVARPGARFRGTNRSGRLLWSRSNVFTVVDEPREIAWRTCGLWGAMDSTQWRIELQRVGNVTRIVQTYDLIRVAPGLDRIYWLIVKAHRDRRDALTDDLQRLAALAEAAQEPVTSGQEPLTFPSARAIRGRMSRYVMTAIPSIRKTRFGSTAGSHLTLPSLTTYAPAGRPTAPKPPPSPS